MRRLFMTITAIGGVATYLYIPLPSAKTEGEAYRLLPKVSKGDNPNFHFIPLIPRKIGIIGGGISGMIVGKTLSQQGYDIEILDKNSEIGGVWLSNYDGAGLQFSYPHFNLPDFTFPENTTLLPRQPEVGTFIKAYAQHFGIVPYVIPNVIVKSIKQNANKSWTVTTNQGNKDYDFLVICTGPYNKPYMPKLPGSEKFKGKILHSSEFVNAEEMCKGKKVVVIGSGKSAFDIVGQARKYQAHTSMIMRKTHYLVPIDLTIFGLPLGYLNSSRLAGLFLDPFYAERSWKDSFTSLVSPLYWAFVTYFIKKGIPENLMPTTPYKNEKHYRGGARDQELYDLIGQKKIPLYRGSVEDFSERGVILNNKEIEADIIVCATGFEREYLGLPSEEDGLWLYRNTILPNYQNLAVVGIVNTYCNPLYTNIQAVWLSEVLRGRVRLPGIYKMNDDIKERKEYTRTIINGEATVCFSWFPYPTIDQFLKDMGLPIERKKNRLAYWFEPIKPSDYTEVVTHRT